MAQALQRVSTAPEPALAHKASCVGPNAAIQLGHALKDTLGDATARQVFAAAGLSAWLTQPPGEMIDEVHVARLFRSLFGHLPDHTARTIAAQAGMRTADYLLRNRIPRPAQIVLKVLPANSAASLLLRAITRNAWTFAGSGTFTAHPGPPVVIEVADNPIAMPGCSWHVGVFERLFRVLVSSDACVSHPKCCHDGASACRFEVHVNVRSSNACAP